MKYIKVYENFDLNSPLNRALQKLDTTIQEVDIQVAFINNTVQEYGVRSNTNVFTTLSELIENSNYSQDILEDFIKEKDRQYKEVKRFADLFDEIDDCKQELDDYYLSIGTRNPGGFKDNTIRNKVTNDTFYTYGFCSHDEKVDGSKIAKISMGIYFQIIGKCYKDEKDIVYQMIHRIEKTTGLKAYGERKSDPLQNQKDYPGRDLYRYAYNSDDKPTCIHVEFYFN